jgi:heme A synthase
MVREREQAVGLALGVAWQLVHRRDLIDRLTVVAVFLTVGAATAFVMRAVAGNVTVDLSHAGGALACLAGLVLTEQALRARDLRAHRRAATSPAEAVPARP